MDLTVNTTTKAARRPDTSPQKEKGLQDYRNRCPRLFREVISVRKVAPEFQPAVSYQMTVPLHTYTRLASSSDSLTCKVSDRVAFSNVWDPDQQWPIKMT